MLFRSVWPQARSGKLRALGVTTLQRMPVAPDVPAIAETVPGYEFGGWQGILVPAGTPQDIVNLLSKEIARGLATQEVKDRLGPLHAKPIGSSPAELAAYTRTEIVRWGKVAKAANIRVD